MIASDVRPRLQGHSSIIKSGVVSNVVTPAPPSSPSRNAPLRRRRQKNISVFHHSAFGLEMNYDEIVWRGWDTGEEYTKNLTLKNIHVKTQIIKYKVPATRFFSTLFPQVIVLSAGTSFTLPVTFKPLEKVKYEDRIEFITSQGAFNIHLQALLPETNLLLPQNLHFGLIAAHDVVEISFEIRNLSTELMTTFSWEVPDPFTILPTTGTIPARGSCVLKGIFRPQSASVFETSAICCYGQDNIIKKVKLEGIGKFPRLLISTASSPVSHAKFPTLKFGCVNANSLSTKVMTLHNISKVRIPFRVRSHGYTPAMDRSFTCLVKEGIVPSNAEIQIPIEFKPNILGKKCIDYFEVSAVGDMSRSTVKCEGASQGPNVYIGAQLLNFGLTCSNKQVTRTLIISNSSKCEAIYQILLDSDSSVWHVNIPSGVLKAGETQTLLVHFTPFHPINYYRRLVILVHEQGPLYVDLIGTCHNEDQQPPLLKPSHLEQYRVHVSRGLSFYSPEILDNQLTEKKLKVDDKNCLMLASDENVTRDIAEDEPMAEFFDDAHNTVVTHNPPHVSLDKLEVWFGQENLEKSTTETRYANLRLTNHTRGKVTAIWMQDQSGVFGLIPHVCDIPPLKSTDFRVAFRPTVPNQFFGAELECYVFYKSMRDYRLVDDKIITPPWCLTFSASGHTFSKRNGSFLPQVKLSSNHIVFPASCENESSYRTMLMKNNGTTPVLYQFNQDSDDHDNTFTVKPHRGIMKSKYLVSVCRLTPKNVEVYESKVTLRLNDNEVHDEHIVLTGTGEQPELLLSNRGELYFPTTCIGTVISNASTIQNIGRLAVEYQWNISSADSKRISVSPERSVLLPNEIQTLKWTFSPAESRKYLFKPNCLTWPYHEDSQVKSSETSVSKRKFTLRIIGEGGMGEIQAEHAKIDFSCIICGSSCSKSLVLQNTSNCNARFRLSVTQTIESEYGENANDREPIVLKLSKYQDVVPARSRTTVTFTAQPQRRVFYKWSVNCELINQEDDVIVQNSSFLCELIAQGVFPTMSVIDARATGSGASISKTQLWRWFSLNLLNSYLDADPDKQELAYSVATRHSTRRKPSVHTRSILDFNFGAAPLDSEPCYVSLMLENTGLATTQWTFMFPKDLQLPLDYWMETGEFDTDELHELHIQDNKLFTVSPQKGELNPGEQQTILLQYKHDIAGTHRIPVLLKMEKGREILLNFTGVTVEPNRRYIHFPGDHHMLTPVPIGDSMPPKQLYEIYNGGSMAVMYEVNMSPLLELQAANFDHPILTCLNTHGEVLPGTCANIEFIFSPLEAKTYMVDIPIHVIGGDTALISFSGIGYDARTIGSQMPMLDLPSEFTAVPKAQMVPVPGQHLFLSEERISFGNIPLFSRVRDILFLTNRSKDRSVKFSWHASSEIVNDVLRIEPVQGRLDPGQVVLTKITFCAAGQPSFYDLDLICEVIDEIKMENYLAELHSWEQEKAKQEVEFIITDSDGEMNHPSDVKTEMESPRQKSLENVLNKSTTPVKLTESVGSNKELKSEVRHYSTLPPIRFEDPVRHPGDRSRANRKKDAMLAGALADEWPRPLPPEPFVCHLGITARTHDIGEFRTHFQDKSSKHFIDRMLQVNNPIPSRPPSEQYILTTCDNEEKDTVKRIMSKVIRNLLDDPTFIDSVKELSKEKTPYFTQLAKEEPHSVETLEEVAKADIRDSQSPKLMDQILKQGEENAAHVSELVESKNIDGEIKLKSVLSSRAVSADTNISSKHSKRQSTRSVAELDHKLKRSPVFGSLLEDILNSTMGNIMNEAISGEVVLTARPRVVALPPSTAKLQQQKPQQEKPTSRSASSCNSGSSGSKRRKADSHASSYSSYSAPHP